MSLLVDSFSNRLKYAITIKNIKPIDLSRKTGISKTNISCYMSGKYEAKADGVKLLADALDVNPVWLMGYDVSMERIEHVYADDWNNKNSSKNLFNKLFSIPVLGRVPAGEPLLADENIEGYLPIDPIMYNMSDPDSYFFLKVVGESMNKIVKNGSYVLIEKQDSAEDGDVVVVLVNGDNEATLKRYKQLNEQFVMLEPVSEDSSFQPITIDLKTTTFKIIGKVIGDFKRW